jgi:hypothetical protein
MMSLRRFTPVAAATVLGMGLLSSVSEAQVRVLPNSQSIINPYYRVAPGLSLNQYAYNVRTIGRAYQHVPPWIYGYNPYPSPIYVTPYAYPTPYLYPTPYPYAATPYPYAGYGSYPYSLYSGYRPY